MKHFLLFFIAFFTIQLANAQEQIAISQDTIYDFKDLDIKPDYKGGVKDFYKFIGKNFRIPNEEGLNGKIITTFVIEIDGSITDIKVLQDIGYGTAKETIRVMQMCPNWIPAQKNGKPVRSFFTMPITIMSSEKNYKKSR